MTQQSYQEVSKQVSEEIFKLKDKRKINYQQYFFELSKKESARFERLFYDENGQAPFSEDLESILFDLRMSGNLQEEYKLIK